MAITLSVSSKQLNDERLQTLSSDLCRSIIKETDIEAELAEGAAQRGARGEPITVGLILLTFFSSKSAVALLNVLKSYFERDSSLAVNIQREDGAKLVISAKNMKPDQIENILMRAKELMGN